MIYCHGLLSQITFDWCYQYCSYDYSLGNFSLTGYVLLKNCKIFCKTHYSLYKQVS